MLRPGFLPNRLPSMTREVVDKLLVDSGVDLVESPLVVVGARGYFIDVGIKGSNNRGVYDDAFFISSPGLFASYNGNTDPNGRRAGFGFGLEKGMASLTEGQWLYRRGSHKGQDAFIQASQVTVMRDGEDGDYLDTGWFGINFHPGGINTTGSQGCQTIPPSQWPSFYAVICEELNRYNQRHFTYLLTTRLIEPETTINSEFGSPGYDVTYVTLKPGSQGSAVRILQLALLPMNLGILPEIIVDGKFGPITAAHVMKFQSLSKLEPTGVVTKKEWDSIRLWINSGQFGR
jgi:hypothetical protein